MGRTAPRRNVGIRTKMFVSFLIISILPVTGAVIGWWSTQSVVAQVQRIAGQNVPMLATTQRMATETAYVVALGPLIDAAATEADLKRLSGEAAARGKLLDQLIAGIGASETAGLRQAAASVLRNVAALEEGAVHRLGLRAQRDRRAAELADAGERLTRALAPVLASARSDLTAAVAGMAETADGTTQSIADELNGRLLPLFQLRGALTGLTKALLLGAVETDRARVLSHATSFEAAASDVQAALRPLAADEAAAAMRDPVRTLLKFGDGDATLFDHQVVRLDPTASAEKRSAAAEAVRLAVGAADRTDAAANEAMLPLALNARSRIAQLGSDMSDRMGELAGKQIPQALGLHEAVGALAVASSRLAGILAEAAGAETTDQLARSRSAAQTVAASIRADLAKLSGSPDAISLQGAVATLLDIGFGTGNIVLLREGELAVHAANAGLIAANRQLAGDLAGQVDRLVGQARAATDAGAAAAIESLGGTRLLQAGFAALSVALGALIAWLYVGRRIVRRLETVTAGVRRLAAGDLQADVGGDGNDEITDIARAVEVFRDNALARQRLEAETRTVAEARERRAAAVSSLIDGFRQDVEGVVSNVASAATQLDGTAGDLSVAAEQTRSQATAVAASAAENSANVEMVASAADQLTASIAEVSRQMIQANAVAEQAVAEAGRADGAVRGLTEAAHRIEEVVGLIASIAGQTNLLALNATIEAARAGEAGKGFAIVASEVKSLAGQTAKATDEIAAQVQEIQRAAGGAVQTIQSIATIIATMNRSTGSVAASVEEQSSATAEIAHNVQRLASGLQHVTRSMGDLNSAAGSTGTAANEVRSAADVLNGQFERLNAAVHRFLGDIAAA